MHMMNAIQSSNYLSARSGKEGDTTAVYQLIIRAEMDTGANVAD